VEHDRLDVGVVEQVAQLVVQVAVVDVDRDGADLERPKFVSQYSGELSRYIPTLAPTPRPASSNACATRAARCSSARQVTRRSPCTTAA